MKYSFLLILLAAGSLRAADPIDKLIEQEQQAREEWMDAGDELPPMYLWGDTTGVALDEPCEGLAFDELIEISRGNAAAQQTVLNLDMPRVRDLLGMECLFRPGDTLMAVGAGEQQRVKIKELVVRRSGTIYSLWGIFETPLATEPLFFSTEDEWTEGSNQAEKVQETKSESRDPEFRSVTISMGAPNAERLEIQRRHNPTIEDDQLPNEQLIRYLNGDAEIIWVERVDVKKGSGHIRVDYKLDYNGDGFIDLIVTGSHENHPYRLILEGTMGGFKMKKVTLF